MNNQTSGYNIKYPNYISNLEKLIKFANENDEKKIFSDLCKNYDFIPSTFPVVPRIVVLGDIHGDYDLLISSLKLAKVIDDNNNWIAEKGTFVVQVGDQVDRCRPTLNGDCNKDKNLTFQDEDSDVKILKFMTKLDKEASKDGSRVISLLGNHEIMNSMGDMRYVSYKGIKGFENYKDPKSGEKFKSGLEARKYAFAPGNEYGTFMGCTRLSTVIIGSWIFVHAGILPSLMKKVGLRDKRVYNINTLIRLWLLGLTETKNIQDLLVNDKYSPFWTRKLGYIPSKVNNKHKECVKYMEPIQKTLRVGSVVVGHTPKLTGIDATCIDKKEGNALYRVDIASSKAFANLEKMYEDKIKRETRERNIQVLIIENDKFSRIITN